METKDKEHLLALKVMRLTRPSLYPTLPIICESGDLPGNIFLQQLLTDLGTPDGFETCSLGNLLMLPQSFGNIFLGETFSCYMSVHNDSNQTVKEVSVKADLQISSQKIMLTGQNDQQVVPTLAPNCNVDDVIYHEIKEIGTHILVHKPLDVKTKFYNAEDYVSDEVYLEAQLQNITSSAICLEKVALEPSSHFTVRQLNTLEGSNGEVKSAFGSINCLNPNDSRQYLFCLTPRPETKVNVKLLKKITSIGKLDIVWRSSMGERGRLQTSQLERMAPGYGDIRLTVEEIPSKVALDGLFKVKFRVINCCERAMDLKLTFTNRVAEGIIWQGISGRHLGKLESHTSFDLELEAVALRAGLQVVSGIHLTDTFLKRTYDYDELAQVFVFVEGPT